MIEFNFAHPLITALGWTLVHFLWQGLVIGAAYALLTAGLRQASAVTRYWLGMGALAAMLLAVIATFAAVFQAPVPFSAGGEWAASQVSTQVVALDISAWDLFVVRLEELLPWAVFAWLTGVFLLSGRIAFDFWQIRKLAIDGVRPLPEPWPEVVERLCESLMMPRLVRVVESAKVSVPMVIGWLSPVILIPPSALMGLTHKQLELIISHELAHVKRLDYLFNVLQLVVETLLFYHPLVRYVAAQVRIERENCCDDIVVARSGDTLAYARALTEVEGLRCSSGMQVVLAATGGHLAGRVRRLAGMPAPQRGAIQWFAVMMLVGASATAFTGARYAAEQRSPAEPVIPAEVIAAPAPVEAAINEHEAEIVEQTPDVERLSPPVARINVAEIATMPAPAVESAAPSHKTPIKVAAVTLPAAKDPVESNPIPAPTSKPEPAAAPPIEDEVIPLEVPVEMNTDQAELRPLPEPVVETAPDESALPEAPQAEIGGGTVSAPVGPKYPRQAKLRGIEGFVKVGYVVNSDGRVESVEILDAVPAQVFEGAVVKALKKWRYEPFTVDGVPHAQNVKQVFEFNVERGEIEEAGKPAPRCRRNTGTRLCRDSMDPGITGVSVVYNTL